MIIAASAYLVVPWLIQNVVDEVLMEKELRMLNAIAFGILGLFIIRGFASYGQTYNMVLIV